MDIDTGNGNGNSYATPEQLVELRTLEHEIRQLESTYLLARSTWARQHGLSFGGARDEYEVLGYDDFITVGQYRAMYERGGIAGRIVDVMPEATWRGEPAMELVEDEDPQKETEFEKAWTQLDRKHQICAKLLRVDKLSRLSTYAVLLIGAQGELSTPLPRARKGADSLLYLMPFLGGGGPGSGMRATHSTIAAGEADATVFEYETNSNSPRFGLPVSYTLRRTDIASPQFARPVHWTRVIHVAEGLLDDEVFGQPALQRVWNLLADLRKVTGGGAEAFWLRANQGLHLDIDKDMALPDVQSTVAALKEQAEAYKHQLTRWLRTRGVSVETLGSDVANFAAPSDAIITQIAGAKAIPKRILTGSEMGELASSQDRENFRDQVIGRQLQYAGPYIARPLVDRLIEYGYLPTPVKGASEYQVKWPHIQVMTEQERVIGAQGWAAVNASQGEVVFTDAEIRDKWAGYEPLTDEQREEIQSRKEDNQRRQMELQQEFAPPPEDQMRAAELRVAESSTNHTFSSVQVQLPPALAEAVLAFGKSLPAFDLCDEEGGLEDDPHITVKYGLHTNNVADVRRALATYVGPIRFTFGKTNVFQSDGYDVLYVEVVSPDLVALNERLSNTLEHTTTYPVYVPHATVAYLKSGLGVRYVGKTNLAGMSATVGTVRFSPVVGPETDVRITGRDEISGVFKAMGDVEGHPFYGNQWTGVQYQHAPRTEGEIVVGGKAHSVAKSQAANSMTVYEVYNQGGRKVAEARVTPAGNIQSIGPVIKEGADATQPLLEYVRRQIEQSQAQDQYSEEHVFELGTAVHKLTEAYGANWFSEFARYKSKGLLPALIKGDLDERLGLKPSRQLEDAKQTEDLELVRLLTTAIEQQQWDIVHRLLGDVEGHPFYGNQWTDNPGATSKTPALRAKDVEHFLTSEREVARRSSNKMTPAEQRDEQFQTILESVRDQAETIEERENAVAIARAYQEAMDGMEGYAQFNADGTPGGSLEKHKGPVGGLTAERAALHDEIVNHFVSKFDRPQEYPTVVVTGGLPGAGKSFAIRQHPGYKDFLNVNSDDVKAMLPEYKGSNSGFLHEESDMIARRVFERAFEARQNMILDVTMKSLGDANKGIDDGLAGRVKKMSEQGYNVQLQFTEVSIDTSVRTALDRYFREGRFVPPSYIRSARSKGQTASSKNYETFATLREMPFVNGWEHYTREYNQGARLYKKGKGGK